MNLLRAYLSFLKVIWRAQGRRSRMRISVGLLPMMVLSSLLEMLGVAAVLPVIHVIVKQEEGEAATGRLASLLESIPEERRLLVVCSFMVGLFVLKSITAILMNLASQRVALDMRFDMSDRIFGEYLSMDYLAFKQRDIPMLLRNVGENIQGVVNGMVIPTFEMFAELCIMAFLCSLLLYIEPVLTLSIASVISLIYALVFLAIRREMSRRGRESTEAGRQVARILLAGFNGFKEVRLWGMANILRNDFRRHSAQLIRNEVFQGTLIRTPRYSLEVLAIAVMSLTVLYYQAYRGSVMDALPFLGLLAMATIRLAPSIHKVYGAFMLINFYNGCYQVVRPELEEMAVKAPAEPPAWNQATPLAVTEITADELEFSYEPGKPVIRQIDLRLLAGQFYGFAGTSGAGKTTLIELLLGLLQPSAGRFLVDGEPLTPDRIPSFYRAVGYVPQDPYIADGTVMDNLTFGFDRSQRSEERAWEVLRIARLDSVVLNLPHGLETQIGERATRLSGGQRQRLAIARALYLDPQMLILDESTSALDSQTEREVMDGIRANRRDRIVISIAHRVTTLQHADTIFVVDEGRIVAEGTFQDLCSTSDIFRQLAAVDDSSDQQPTDAPH